MGTWLLQNFIKFLTLVYTKCNVETSSNNTCLLLYLFNFQMTPKSLKYFDKERHDDFSCKHENTYKSMKITTLWNYFWSLTVYINPTDVIALKTDVKVVYTFLH